MEVIPDYVSLEIANQVRGLLILLIFCLLAIMLRLGLK